jgi:ketosteroid isomerase-like protein
VIANEVARVTKGPTPKEMAGKYVVVWERVGKQWKLAADIWNDGN